MSPLFGSKDTKQDDRPFSSGPFRPQLSGVDPGCLWVSITKEPG